MTLVSASSKITLRPGEYAVANAGCVIHTLLGSCVSVTLWHPKLRIGAMSHFLLMQRGPASGSAPDPRYGEESLDLMLRDLSREHVFPAQCQAKIFGGGNMFPDQNLPGALHVGRRNGEGARLMLQRRGISIVSESLFGHGHRQIAFDVSSGHVWVRLAHQTSGFAPLPGEAS